MCTDATSNGALGDRIGGWKVLAIVVWGWAALTLLSGVVPGRLFVGTYATYIELLTLRFLLGVLVAPIFPMCARLIVNWQPVSIHGLAFALIVGGVFLGSAVTPPVMAWVMSTIGWRGCFYLSTIPVLVVAWIWTSRGRDHPNDHPKVTTQELTLIHGVVAAVGPMDGPEVSDELKSGRAPRTVSWKQLLSDRSLVLLYASYFFFGYVAYVFVFWMFIYFIEVRKFGVVESGFVAGLPFVTATLLSPLGGRFCDWGTRRWGALWGRRIPGIVGPCFASLCLYLGIHTQRPTMAAVALAMGVCREPILGHSNGPRWQPDRCSNGDS